MAAVNVSQPMLAKYRADRLNINETTKRQTNDAGQTICAAAFMCSGWNGESVRKMTTIDATNSASKIQNKTTKKSRCRSVNSVRMPPNRSSVA